MFEHSMSSVLESYALENVVFYITVNEMYKPYISNACNTGCSNTAINNGSQTELQSTNGCGLSQSVLQSRLGVLHPFYNPQSHKRGF